LSLYSVPLNLVRAFVDAVNPQFLVCRFHECFSEHVDALENAYGWPILRHPHSSLEYPQLHPYELCDPDPRSTIIDYVRAIFRLIEKINSDSPLLRLINRDVEKLRWRNEHGGRQESHLHLATYPNEALFSVAGSRTSKFPAPRRHAEDDAIYGWITEQATALLEIRDRAREAHHLKSSFLNDVILFFPHYFLEFFFDDDQRNAWIQSRRSRESALLALVDPRLVEEVRGVGSSMDNDPFTNEIMPSFCEILFFQDSFLFSCPAIEPYQSMMETEQAAHYMNLAAAEVASATASVAILSVNTAAPVLRFSPALRKCFEALLAFVNTYRDLVDRSSDEEIGPIPPSPIVVPRFPRHRNQDIIADAYNAFVAEAISVFPQSYRNILSAQPAIKTVSDFPFEWLRLTTLPLTYTREFSRIPNTPGQVLSEVAVHTAEIDLRLSDLHTIRVITSFSDDDPLAGAFCRSLRDGFQLLKQDSSTKHLSIELDEVVVTDSKQFVDALVSAPGAIVVIDMHGGLPTAAVGGLFIEESPFSSIEFEYEIQKLNRLGTGPSSFPAIVIFSSCDTLSPMANGFSMASAVLRAGAIAVLATLLPVDAERSSFLIGKILLESCGFLSEPSGVDLTWRNMVCDQLHYAAAIDWFGACAQMLPSKVKTLEQYFSGISKAAGSRIGNILGSEDRLIVTLSEFFAVSTDEIRQIIQDKAPFVDAMSYVQLGFPEKIMLRSPSPIGEEGFAEIDLFDEGLMP